MSDLTSLQAEASRLATVFEDTLSKKFPLRTKWDWYRAIDAVSGGIARRNDDTSQDAALAADADILAAHDAYIKALHDFYRARDGERGFLGKYDPA